MISLYVDAGPTPTTAIPVGVAVRAGGEGAGGVAATGAQSAGPGEKLPKVSVLPASAF